MSFSSEVSARFHPVRAARTISFATGTVGRLIAPGAVTNGDFGLFRWEMPAGTGGASAHYHKNMSESCYVLSGTVRLFDGARWVDATAGDFLHVPRNGVHGFDNESDQPASMLILFSPGLPRENYFRELAERTASGSQYSPENRREFLARHDQYDG
jgi:quercetin dioxygenase-like cupin family protein